MNELGDLAAAHARANGFSMIPKNQPVTVRAWFFLKRPLEDFVSRRRAPNNLRPEAKNNPIVPVKPDTDNMAKFLLDSLTGVLFDDDSQVWNLHMWKLRDSIGLCEGKVAFHVKRGKTDGDWQSIMPEFMEWNN